MDSSQNAALGGNCGSGGNGTLTSQTNDLAASAAGADDSMQNLNQISNSIQKTLGLIHQLYLTVSTFNAAFQMPLLQRINGLVVELDNMIKLAEKCNIQIPMEVVNLIDDGKNPDEFTRDVLNNCIAKNQITKGKTDAVKSFRKHFLEELEQNFPDEVETFRESRAASAAEKYNADLRGPTNLQQRSEEGVNSVREIYKQQREVEGRQKLSVKVFEELKRLAQAQSVLPNGDVRVKAEH